MAAHQLPVSSAATSSIQPPKRRSAGFRPSMWGDYFLEFSSNSMAKHENVELEVEKLKVDVKDMLIQHQDVEVKLLDKLDLVDQIQRLGIGYHFETEIDELLNKIHTKYLDGNILGDSSDLCTTSLLFRLLRQQGYYISCDIFKRFTNEKGTFNVSLGTDVRGLLSLYEASYLKIHGEEILEEALDFSTTHLNKFMKDQRALNSSLAAEVSHALEISLHQRTPRLQSRDYIDMYQQKDSRDEVLLSLAKLDFNLLQELHQSELGDLTRWWINLDLGRKLHFARDRLVECYIWSLGHFEPQHSYWRKVLTKVITLTSVMDDIYDLYGTLEELSLLTSIIDRWETGAVNELPEYLQHFFLAFVDVIVEIEEKLVEEGRPDYLCYAKEGFKIQAWAYFNEAKWYHQSHMPTVEEYMSVAAISATFLFFTSICYLAIGHIATKESFEWVLAKPKMMLACSVVGRLTNDLASHKFERKRGDAPSAVECYIEQHHVLEQEALKALSIQLDDAWKDMNNECLFVPDSVSRSLLFPMLNFARLCVPFYSGHEDRYTTPDIVIKKIVDFVLINPILFWRTIL